MTHFNLYSNQTASEIMSIIKFPIVQSHKQVLRRCISQQNQLNSFTHTPALSLPLHCLKSVQYNLWPNIIPPNRGCLFPCASWAYWNADTSASASALLLNISAQCVLAVKVDLEIRAETGLDPAVISEEVVLQLPLHQGRSPQWEV